MDGVLEFEGLFKTFVDSLETDEWKQLQKDFNDSDNIFFIANGGGHAVATHGKF